MLLLVPVRAEPSSSEISRDDSVQQSGKTHQGAQECLLDRALFPRLHRISQETLRWNQGPPQRQHVLHRQGVPVVLSVPGISGSQQQPVEKGQVDQGWFVSSVVSVKAGADSTPTITRDNHQVSQPCLATSRPFTGYELTSWQSLISDATQQVVRQHKPERSSQNLPSVQLPVRTPKPAVERPSSRHILRDRHHQ